MSDRVALVTGSTSGIGAAIARRLAREGYKVALHGRSSGEVGRAMAAELPGASYHQADLGDAAHAGGLVRAVLAHYGRLDVLVNNAGEAARIAHADLKAATPEVWRRMMEVNLIAPWMLIAEAEPALRKSAEQGRPAAIVNIGTHAAVRPKGASIPYAAAKAALHHTTRLLALALGPAIRVNCVAPGLVETPMTRGLGGGPRAVEHPLADEAGGPARGHRRSGGRAWSPTTTLPGRSSSPMVG